MLDRNFGNIVWTNHALSRLEERGIKQGDAWATWRNPDQSRFAASRGAWVYYKTWGQTKVEVVAKQNERGQWVVLSVWAKPAGKRFLDEKPESLLNLIFRCLFKK